MRKTAIIRRVRRGSERAEELRNVKEVGMLSKSLIQRIEDEEMRRRRAICGQTQAEKMRETLEIVRWREEEYQRVTKEEWIEEYWRWRKELADVAGRLRKDELKSREQATVSDWTGWQNKRRMFIIRGIEETEKFLRKHEKNLEQKTEVEIRNLVLIARNPCMTYGR